MEALAVVKGLDEIKDGLAGLGSGFEVTAIDEFVFEGAPEGFHGGIVVAVAFAAHGGDGLRALEGIAIVVTGVLNAAVGMKHQARGRLTMSQSHSPSGQDQFGVDVFAHSPAGEAAAVQVHDASQIEPAFLGCHVGDVPEPDLVGGAGRGQVRQAIGGDGLVVVAVGGADTEPAFGASTQALQAH